MSHSRSRGAPALLLLGLLALVRAWVVGAPPPAAWQSGEPVPLRLEDLRGAEFRLLPGVGPVLAERLEAARVAAGGRLLPERVQEVPGVGPALAARWAALRPQEIEGMDACPQDGGFR
ncbi:MAG TPA: hypothetical protein VFY71_04670 [Planctomycetota bacterium]|nr:hypothetical protein [Planctomycetota bacterium]